MKNDKNKDLLNLASLHERHPGLTASLGGAFTEAASVCLDRHHTSPLQISVASCGLLEKKCTIEFVKPDKRELNAWANVIDTTEFGAYGVCLAAVEKQEGLVAVRRAETLTGADWYVAPVGTDVEDLESCFRLEVSGVDSGEIAIVKSRLKQKIVQTQRGTCNLPAIASVVGFKALTVMIEKVNGEK